MADEKPVMTEVQRWLLEIELAKRNDRSFIERGKKINDRYRDNIARDANVHKRFNILWSNVQTLTPAIYARPPKPEVIRRNKDGDPAARTASTILERCLNYEIEQFNDFHDTVSNCVLDRNLSGRGTAWVRFETEEIESIVETDATPEDVADEDDDQLDNGEATPDIDSEGETQLRSRACVDYVYWQDFRCSPARTWDEVTWVARRIYMTRDQGADRFGSKFERAPLLFRPVGLDEMAAEGRAVESDDLQRAKVWEIWDKTDRKVFWVCEGFDELLDSKEDPYKLDEFFPCPKPLYATLTTDSLIPVADFVLYQDQAEEVDMLTAKIGQLTEALKVAGTYDAGNNELAQLLEAPNNRMIPVTNWAGYSQAGGMNGSVDWFPLDPITKALTACLAAREQAKQVIYEITGISDIIRGASKASETATAQNIKRQFGTLRLSSRQRDVAQFCTDILRIKAQLMMDLYEPRQLAEMSGIENTPDAEHINDALALLKVEPLRAYRINVSTDSMVELDQEAEQAQRLEFISAAGGFLAQAMPLVENVPALASLAGQMLLFGVRGMKGGRDLEGAFEQAVSAMEEQAKQPKPDPNQAVAQAEQQKLQMTQQLEQQKMQFQMQTEQMKLQADMQAQQARMQADMQVETARQQLQAQLEAERARRDQEVEAFKVQTKLQADALQAEQQMAFSRGKAELDAAVKIQVANIGTQAKVDNAATQAATDELGREIQP